MNEILKGIGGDFLQMIMTLAILLAIVFFFWLWSVGGMLLFVFVLLTIGLAYLLYKVYMSGGFSY